MQMLKKLNREEIKEFFNELQNKNDFQKIQFYNLAYSESQRRQKIKDIEKLFENYYFIRVHTISDDISVVETIPNKDKETVFKVVLNDKEIIDEVTVSTLDEGILLGILYKYGCTSGFSFVASALNMNISKMSNIPIVSKYKDKIGNTISYGDVVLDLKTQKIAEIVEASDEYDNHLKILYYDNLDEGCSTVLPEELILLKETDYINNLKSKVNKHF